MSQSAIGTLVDRTSRYLRLVHLRLVTAPTSSGLRSSTFWSSFRSRRG
ncbi:hypothetical protein ABTX15_32320 [Micromonospora sp. NPDC094482]